MGPGELEEAEVDGEQGQVVPRPEHGVLQVHPALGRCRGGAGAVEGQVQEQEQEQEQERSLAYVPRHTPPCQAHFQSHTFQV